MFVCLKTILCESFICNSLAEQSEAVGFWADIFSRFLGEEYTCSEDHRAFSVMNVADLLNVEGRYLRRKLLCTVMSRGVE